LNCFFEFYKRNGLAGDDIEHPHAAHALIERCVADRNTAEDRAFAHLREAHKGVAPAEIQPACEARKSRDFAVAAIRDVDNAQAARAGVEHPQLPSIPAWRVWHRETIQQHLVAGEIDQDTTIALALAPTAGLVA